MRLLPLSLAVLFSVSHPAPAQPGDSLIVGGKRMLRAGVNAGSLDTMYAARGMFERVLADTGLSAWGHYYIALADHSIVNYLLGRTGDRKQASEHLKSSVHHLREAIRLDPRSAEAHALMSSAYGRQISLNPVKWIFLGRRVGKALEKAREIAPDNPRVVLCAALSDYHTPQVLGGSRERGIQGFRRATELFARGMPADPIRPEWGHSQAWAWLGIAHRDRGETELARAAYERALEINPEFGWVRNGLLYELDKGD